MFQENMLLSMIAQNRLVQHWNEFLAARNNGRDSVE
jgi:hypothetical protein